LRTLQARLDAIKAAFSKKAPPEAKALMTRATEDLRSSGILERLPKEGDTLPSFELTESGGATVRSADLVGPGHLVVSFYRGKW
jgi:hypothetical protein